jgi:hypothetical protein
LPRCQHIPTAERLSGFTRAADILFNYLTAVAWNAVALALLCHLAKMACRTRSWLNILAASYPGVRIRWRGIFGAYVAGVGVNAIMPARAMSSLCEKRLKAVTDQTEG